MPLMASSRTVADTRSTCSKDIFNSINSYSGNFDPRKRQGRRLSKNSFRVVMTANSLRVSSATE
jgi:hypothetical protein